MIDPKSADKVYVYVCMWIYVCRRCMVDVYKYIYKYEFLKLDELPMIDRKSADTVRLHICVYVFIYVCMHAYLQIYIYFEV
jgi:hypothetical protein